MYCQVNSSKQLKALMLLIGKAILIPAFEQRIGIPWKEAKMSNFYACGLGQHHNKGVLYYLDGKREYGSLVIECPIEYILQVRELEE